MSVRMAPLLASVLVAGLLSSCARAGDAGGGTIGDMWGQTYLSTAVTDDGKDRPLVAGTRITLSFEKEGEIGAQAGCNHLFGTATLDGDILVVDDVGGTEMGCEAPLQAQDEWLIAFLGSRPTWKTTGDELVLRSGKVELRLLDRRVADPDRPLAGTKWVVESLISGDSVSSLASDDEAFLTIDSDGKLTGNTGCNNMGGSTQVTASTVTFGDLFTTKMACLGAAGDLEQAVLEVLNGEVKYSIKASMLTLTHPSGKGLQLRAQG